MSDIVSAQAILSEISIGIELYCAEREVAEWTSAVALDFLEWLHARR